MSSALIYHKAKLVSTKNDNPIGEVLIPETGKCYYYFTEISGEITAGEEYWFHIAKLPIPKSFQLLRFSFDGSNIINPQHIAINQPYDESAEFLLSIQPKDFLKEVFSYTPNVGFDDTPLNNKGILEAKTYGWDYKKSKSNSLIPMSCGSKCRETLTIDRTSNNFQLLVFFSEEAKQGENVYYIPTLGQTACTFGTAADIVYFNANAIELINGWLLPLHDKKAKNIPGIAEEHPLQYTPFPKKSFKNGTGNISVSYTSDSNRLAIKPTCTALYVSCH